MVNPADIGLNRCSAQFRMDTAIKNKFVDLLIMANFGKLRCTEEITNFYSTSRVV